MSDLDWDDDANFVPEQENTTAPAAAVEDDWETIVDEPVVNVANEDVGADLDDWENDDVQKPAAKKPETAAAPAKAPATANKKKQQAAAIREKEEAEKRLRVQQARMRAMEAEALKRSQDPNYSANRKEAERLAVLEAEASLASDLLGGPVVSKPKPVEVLSPEDEAMRLQAARLAAATGLSDGADGMDAINDPSAKTAGVAPSPFDAIDFNTKENFVECGNKLVEKVNSTNVNGGPLELLKTLVNGIGPNMKVDDIAELLRVVNVVKNEANKALQNKKKKSKGKPTLKAIGSAYDDYDNYDDSYSRNDADDGFF